MKTMKIFSLILATGFLYGCNHETPASKQETKDITEKINMIEGDKDIMKEGEDKMKMDHMNDKKEMGDIDLMQYTNYTDEKFKKLKGKQKFVVFFHAQWCGACKVWEKKVKDNLASLPANTIILKADYDTQKDLVKNWHVKSQSSVVFFNHTGEIVDTVIDPKLDVLKEFFNAPDTENIAIAGSKYETFSTARYNELKGKQKFIIFFYADWCSTCRAWEKKFMAAVNTLPANTLVLKANYDNDVELKKEFGIKMQSVAAFINADGTTAKTEPDPSMESLTKFFQ